LLRISIHTPHAGCSKIFVSEEVKTIIASLVPSEHYTLMVISLEEIIGLEK
jgi:hypothetical protein